MPEAGWLLLLLFLGVCSLIVVGVLWPSFQRAHQTTHKTLNAAVARAQQAQEKAPFAPTLTPPEKTAQAVKPLSEWLSLVNDHPDEAPHTLIIGSSGAGKTTLAEAIIATRGGYLVILDPKWKPGRWGNLKAIPIDDDGRYTQIEAAIKSLLLEFNMRLVSLKLGVTTFADVTVVIEELPTLIVECPSAATLLKQIGRMGRELRIRVLGLSQSERVKSLGVSGEGDALDNYTLIRLGKAAVGTLPAAQSMERPAVLEWRGQQHLMDTQGVQGLALRPLHASRSWPLLQPELPGQEVKPIEPAKESIELRFSVEELGKIAASIVRKTERTKAIRAMPRYSRKQHQEFAAFFDEFKQAMSAATPES